MPVDHVSSTSPFTNYVFFQTDRQTYEQRDRQTQKRKFKAESSENEEIGSMCERANERDVRVVEELRGRVSGKMR